MAEIRIIELPEFDLVDGTYIVVDKQSGTGKYDISTLATSTARGMMSSADKSKLDGIEDNAQENVIESITVNGAEVQPSEKTVALQIPSVDVATPNSAGVVKPDGTTITVDSDGTIHGASPYELPTMTATTKGGAKLGDGLAITDGALGIDPTPQESTGAVRGAISSLTAKGWATQDGTPTPESPVPIQVARGRNLLRTPYVDDAKTSQNGLTFAVLDDGGIRIDGTASATTYWNLAATGSKAYEVTVGTYTISVQGLAQGISLVTNVNVSGTNKYSKTLGADGSQTVDYEEGGVLRSYLQISSGSTVHTVVYPQLELGSTPTPYVPYGHVGVEVRQGSTLISAIPVPLPSKGFAASLPDGTADVLTIDGAGHVEWESAVARIESYAGETVGAVYLSTTGELSTGAEVYYPLATPATEQCGYIDWPSIPDGAIITCPELDALGVRYLIGNGVTEIAREWYERAKSEYEGRILALEQAVAELATA